MFPLETPLWAEQPVLKRKQVVIGLWILFLPLSGLF